MLAKNGTYAVDPPKVTWILVANRAEAAVFRREKGMPVQFVERWENENLQRGNGELPARQVEEAARFARQLARMIGKRRSQGRFTGLVVVAEPHFLGMLRSSLPKALVDVVEVPRELRFSDTKRVERKLREWERAVA